MGVLDLLFPKHCVGCKRFGSYICTLCFTKIQFIDSFICLVCNRATIDGQTHPHCRGRYTIDGATASISYRGLVKKLVYQFKYQPHLSDLQHVLGELLYEGLIQQEQFHIWLKTEPVFVPIPLSWAKLRKRGYNQAQLLGKSLAEQLFLPFQDVLIRVKDTKTQVQLRRDERMQNIKGAFALKQTPQLESVILVDDVITSGATMLEAARVLKKAGVKRVFGVSLAHGQ